MFGPNFGQCDSRFASYMAVKLQLMLTSPRLAACDGVASLTSFQLPVAFTIYEHRFLEPQSVLTMPGA